MKAYSRCQTLHLNGINLLSSLYLLDAQFGFLAPLFILLNIRRRCKFTLISGPPAVEIEDERHWNGNSGNASKSYLDFHLRNRF